MSAFNRVFVVISLGFLLILGAAFLIVPNLVIGIVQSLADSLEAALFAGLSDVGRFAVRALLALGWVALFAFFIWLEVRRVGTRTVEVARYTGGNTIRVSTAAVAERIRESVAAVEGVLEAQVSAIGRDRAVEIKVNVFAERSVDLIAKAEEIAALVRRVTQDELGLKLAAKPQIAIQPRDGRAESQPKLLRLPARPAPRPASVEVQSLQPPARPEVVLPATVSNFPEEPTPPARAEATTAPVDEPLVESEPTAATAEHPVSHTPDLAVQSPAEVEPTPSEVKDSVSIEADDRDTSEARRNT